MANDPIGPEDDEQLHDGVCPACGGTGERDGMTCARCDGTGRLVEGIGGG